MARSVTIYFVQIGASASPAQITLPTSSIGEFWTRVPTIDVTIRVLYGTFMNESVGPFQL